MSENFHRCFHKNRRSYLMFHDGFHLFLKLTMFLPLFNIDSYNHINLLEMISTNIFPSQVLKQS